MIRKSKPSSKSWSTIFSKHYYWSGPASLSWFTNFPFSRHAPRRMWSKSAAWRWQRSSCDLWGSPKTQTANWSSGR